MKIEQEKQKMKKKEEKKLKKEQMILSGMICIFLFHLSFEHFAGLEGSILETIY